MKKYTAALAIFGLLVLGGALIAKKQAASQNAAPTEKSAQPGPRGRLARLGDYLKLTPEQEAKLKDFQKVRADEQKAFRDQLSKLRGELNPLWRDPKADLNKVDALIDQTSKLRADRLKKSLQARRDFEKIFTPEQLEKLRAFRGHMMWRGPMTREFGMGRSGFGPGAGRFTRRTGPGWGQRMGPGGFMGKRGFFGCGRHGRPWQRFQQKRGPEDTKNW